MSSSLSESSTVKPKVDQAVLKHAKFQVEKYYQGLLLRSKKSIAEESGNILEKIRRNRGFSID